MIPWMAVKQVAVWRVPASIPGAVQGSSRCAAYERKCSVDGSTPLGLGFIFYFFFRGGGWRREEADNVGF